jgi:lipoate-protein ligase A
MPAAAYSMHKNTPPSAACFDSPSHYELTINGRKLIGSAQVRKHGIILQHGSILLDFRAQELTSILRLSLENKLRTAAILKKRVISLHDALGRMPTYDEVRDAMEAGFTEALHIKLQAGELTAAENAAAATLRAEKYAQEQWLDKR